MSSDDVDELFPAPSFPPSQLSPQRLPGTNLESLRVATLQDVLKENHQRYHIFFNDAKFHNHIAHRALAIYGVGGSAAIIREHYQRDSRRQRPAIQSPEPITEENFVAHLGNDKFYQGYVSFFAQKASEKGIANTLEEFVFSEQYNFRKGEDADAQPELLSHFLQGLVHPMIHVGYGVEFGLKGMVVEGLALAAVEPLRVRGSFASFFAPSSTLSIVSKTGGVHVFDIVARMLKDDTFKRRDPTDFLNPFVKILDEYSPTIREHAEQWTVDLSQPGEVERKMEELVWLSSFVYGVGGLTPNGFKSDFFLMHMVTSSLFLPSLITSLSPRSQILLLRGYLSTVLTWWIMRGQPALNIKSFMATTSVELPVPTTPASNPFLPVLKSAITHPHEHVVKIQRAFAHFDALYGKRAAGYFKGTELEDAELLDGSLFRRVSLLTADYTERLREGKKLARPFSYHGV